MQIVGFAKNSEKSTKSSHLLFNTDETQIKNAFFYRRFPYPNPKYQNTKINQIPIT